MNKVILLTTCALIWGSLSLAQTASSAASDRLFFEFATLDFNKYAELHETVKADGNYTIETVCIPAKVICVKKVNANSSISGFKQLATLTGLSAIESPQSMQAFEERCLDARTRN